MRFALTGDESFVAIDWFSLAVGKKRCRSLLPHWYCVAFGANSNSWNPAVSKKTVSDKLAVFCVNLVEPGNRFISSDNVVENLCAGLMDGKGRVASVLLVSAAITRIAHCLVVTHQAHAGLNGEGRMGMPSKVVKHFKIGMLNVWLTKMGFIPFDVGSGCKPMIHSTFEATLNKVHQQTWLHIPLARCVARCALWALLAAAAAALQGDTFGRECRVCLCDFKHAKVCRNCHCLKKQEIQVQR